MCVQSLRLGRFSYIQMASLFIFQPYFLYPFPLTEELISEVASPFIGSKYASVGVLVVIGKEALTVSIAIPVAIQLTVTMLVVPVPVFQTTSLMLLVGEGIPVVILFKVLHERQERIRVCGLV